MPRTVGVLMWGCCRLVCSMLRKRDTLKDEGGSRLTNAAELNILLLSFRQHRERGISVDRYYSIRIHSRKYEKAERGSAGSSTAAIARVGQVPTPGAIFTTRYK